MPHKHKRRRTEGGASFNLPPTSNAKPLPAFTREPRHLESGIRAAKKSDVKRSRRNGHDGPGKTINTEKDDTPRAFAQLLQFHRTGKGLAPALDDGRRGQTGKKKRQREGQKHHSAHNAASDGKRKKEDEEERKSEAEMTATTPPLQIQPGERLAEFSARVDQSLPFSHIRASKGGLGVKDSERKTKHNRRLERMQKQWREEAARRKEKLEERMDDREDEREEQALLWTAATATAAATSAGASDPGKGKRRKKGPTTRDEDPWAELDKKKGEESRQKNLQDVVQAPPQLKGVVVRNRFKQHDGGGGSAAVVVDVDNVPARIGSLRKREEAAEIRRRVIDEYRKKHS